MTREHRAKTWCTADRCKRCVAIALLVALVISLIPLYTLSAYSYAGLDDYRYGLTTHAVWEETRSITKTVAEAGRVASRTYFDWQGSVAAVFLMALQPGIFNDGLYWLSTALLLTVLTLSILFFVVTACVTVFRADADTARIIAALTAIACIQFVPTPVESYYWFNGGLYYTFFFSLSLISAALLMRRTQARSAWQCVLLVMLTAMIGLGNLVTGLLCCVLLVTYAIMANLRGRRDPLLWSLAAILLITFAVNALSPGNDVRQAENAHKSQGAVAAILAAMGDAGAYSAKWMLTPAPYLMLLPIPLYRRLADASQLRFRYPLHVSAASFLLLAAGFTPNEYALGFAGEARIIDIQYYLFVLLFSLNVLWYTGWLRRRLPLSARARKAATIAVMLACAAAACGITIGTRNAASASAVLFQRNGKAQSYADTWETRLTMLHDAEQARPILPRMESQPPLLCMVDIAVSEADPYYFYNEQLAYYFDKESVLRAP